MKRFQLKEIKIASRMASFLKDATGKNASSGGGNTSTGGSVTSTATVGSGD